MVTLWDVSGDLETPGGQRLQTRPFLSALPSQRQAPKATSMDFSSYPGFLGTPPG